MIAKGSWKLDLGFIEGSAIFPQGSVKQKPTVFCTVQARLKAFYWGREKTPFILMRGLPGKLHHSWAPGCCQNPVQTQKYILNGTEKRLHSTATAWFSVSSHSSLVSCLLQSPATRIQSHSPKTQKDSEAFKATGPFPSCTGAAENNPRYLLSQHIHIFSRDERSQVGQHIHKINKKSLSSLPRPGLPISQISRSESFIMIGK